MKKLFYFLFIISLALFIVSANPFGIIFSNGVNAQDKTPEDYTIKKGDTLWDISDSALDDSFLWPKLWKVNPQIKNPDNIYPGDKIRIPSREELMRMFADVEEVPVEEPVIIEKPELPKEYIVDKNRYIASGWISDKYPGIGEIISAPTSRTVFGTNDLVYLKTDGSAAVGDKFFVIRDVKEVKHPKTGKSLGHQLKITGILEVIGMDGRDNDIPKAQITTALEDSVVGDGLIPYSALALPVVPDIVRTPIVRGYIVETYTNSLMARKGDIIYLDKGQNDGLKVGDIFSALSDTPVERSIGRIQIITLHPKTSVATIIKSDEDLKIGDEWGKK